MGELFMKLYFESDNSILLETSLNRLRDKNQKHDICFITAYKANCTKRENEERNRNLQGILDSLGYMDKTRVFGRYENQERKSNGDENYVDKEVSFAVVNTEDSDSFKTNMIKLMDKFDQESILYCYAGGKSEFIYSDGSTEGNKAWHFGKDSQFKSLVNGRPLVIENLSEVSRMVRSQGQYNKYIEMFN